MSREIRQLDSSSLATDTADEAHEGGGQTMEMIPIGDRGIIFEVVIGEQRCFLIRLPDHVQWTDEDKAQLTGQKTMRKYIAGRQRYVLETESVEDQRNRRMKRREGARMALKKKGCDLVKVGGIWYEEHPPSETIESLHLRRLEMEKGDAVMKVRRHSSTAGMPAAKD